jgi:hypothetical protein
MRGSLVGGEYQASLLLLPGLCIGFDISQKETMVVILAAPNLFKIVRQRVLHDMDRDIRIPIWMAL